MRRVRSRLARMVVLMVVGALTLTGCDFSVYSLPLPGGADVGDNPYTVKVEFRDVLDLVPQSSVKVNDISVGRVEDIEADGYHALVTLTLRRSVKLPDNAVATIRQTSLLGEKFVSLAPPETGASSGRLGNNDVIPLARSGRNPEVEEVLGALSLLLNGGGVARLKTIATELNHALEGRETNVKSVLNQLDLLMSQLDQNKDAIVRAIESLNRLAIALNKQKPSITRALDELPQAVASINRQRDDLVKMLRALADLSAVGTRVISASKTATIDSLQALAPTLTKLAESGDSFPKALQVFLTYPFVDAVVGKTAAQARNLHMGDYTNLSVQLDLNLSDFAIDQVCATLPPELQDLPLEVCDNPALEACLTDLAKTDPTQPGFVQQLTNALRECGKGARDTICKSPQLPAPLKQACAALPQPPGPDLPPLPDPLTPLQECLRSGAPLGPACDRVDPRVIAQTCAPTTADRKPRGYNSETCQRYRELGLGITRNGELGRLPTGGGSGSGSGSGGVLGGGGLTGLNRAGFGDGPAPTTSTRTSPESDLGALLVWGMMAR